MSASKAPRQLEASAGYLALLRGKEFQGYDASRYRPLWNYRLLPGRAGDAGALLFCFIYDHTWSALNSPQWADIPLSAFCAYFPHKTPEAIRKELKHLEEIDFIERNAKNPWRFKTHPENIEKAPVRKPVKHPNAAAKKRAAKEQRARSAMVKAPNEIAAFSHDLPETRFNGQTASGGAAQASIVIDKNQAVKKTAIGATFSPPEDVKPLSQNMTQAVRSSDLAGYGPISNPSEITPALLKRISSTEEARAGKLVSMTSEQDSPHGIPVYDNIELSNPLNKTHCPYDWVCPFISNELSDRKPLILLSLEAGKPDLLANPDEVELPTAGQIADIRQLLLDEWGDRIPEDEPTGSLGTRIHKALQGAPLEWQTRDSRGIGLLRHRLRSRAWNAQSYGLAESIAKDVGTAWRKQSALLRKNEIEERKSEVARMIAHATSSFSELNRSWTALKELAMGS